MSALVPRLQSVKKGINVKKTAVIHTVNGDGSKTAKVKKVIKRQCYPH